MSVDEMDLIELNEAFASVAAACSTALNLPQTRRTRTAVRSPSATRSARPGPCSS